MFESFIIRGLESLGGFGGVADRLNQYNHFLGDPGYLPKDLERYRTATTAALQKVVREKLTKQSRVVTYVVPGKKVIEDVPRAAEAGAREGQVASPAPALHRAILPPGRSARADQRIPAIPAPTSCKPDCPSGTGGRCRMPPGCR